MKTEFKTKLEQSIMIDLLVKDQIIEQRDSLTENQQDMIEQYIVMWMDIQWDLYQKAIANNPDLEQWLLQILNKYQTQTLAWLWSDEAEADSILESLSL